MNRKTAVVFGCGLLTGWGVLQVAFSYATRQKQSHVEVVTEAPENNGATIKPTIQDARKTIAGKGESKVAANKVTNTKQIHKSTCPREKLSPSTARPSNGKQRRILQRSATYPHKNLSRSTARPSNGKQRRTLQRSATCNGKQRIINQQSARRAVHHKRTQILLGTQMVRQQIHSMMANTPNRILNDRSNGQHAASKQLMVVSNARLRGKGSRAACSPVRGRGLRKRGRRRLSRVEEEISEHEESEHEDQHDESIGYE